MKEYTYSDCIYCGGRVSERLLQKECWKGHKIVALINDVPTGVCEQCGERYYKANVIKRVEEILKDRNGMTAVEIPMGEFTEV